MRSDSKDIRDNGYKSDRRNSSVNVYISKTRDCSDKGDQSDIWHICKNCDKSDSRTGSENGDIGESRNSSDIVI